MLWGPMDLAVADVAEADKVTVQLTTDSKGLRFWHMRLAMLG